VSLGLTTQIDLDAAVMKAAKKSGHVEVVRESATLKPASETLAEVSAPDLSTPDSLAPSAPKEKEAAPDADSVFAAFSNDDKKED